MRRFAMRLLNLLSRRKHPLTAGLILRNIVHCANPVCAISIDRFIRRVVIVQYTKFSHQARVTFDIGEIGLPPTPHVIFVKKPGDRNHFHSPSQIQVSLPLHLLTHCRSFSYFPGSHAAKRSRIRTLVSSPTSQRQDVHVRIHLPMAAEEEIPI
jgi:hypothetical protein